MRELQFPITRNRSKHYRYFYAITSDVDDSDSAGKVYKVDTLTGEVKTFYEENTYCAEPYFVARYGHYQVLK